MRCQVTLIVIGAAFMTLVAPYPAVLAQAPGDSAAVATVVSVPLVVAQPPLKPGCFNRLRIAAGSQDSTLLG
jgi:hypothetical protein